MKKTKKIRVKIVSERGHDTLILSPTEAFERAKTEVENKGKWCYVDGAYIPSETLSVNDLVNAEEIVLTSALEGGSLFLFSDMDFIVDFLFKRFENQQEEIIVMILKNSSGGLIFKEIENTSENKGCHYFGEKSEYYEILKETKFMSDKPKYELLGIAHNHPSFIAYPSSTDLKYMFYDISYFIYSDQDRKMNVFNNKGVKI